MNTHDRAILDHVYRSLPIDLDEVDFASLTLVGRVALALGAPSTTVLAWYRQSRGEVRDRVDNLLFLAVDEPEVANLVDAKLEGPEAAGIAEDLVRVGIPWAHPRLSDLLDGDGRAPGAWLLVETEDEAVAEHLEQDEIEYDELVDLLRPAAILGVSDYVAAGAGHRDDLAPGDEAARLDALICAMDPDVFLRRCIQGRSNWTWLGHAVSVADVLHAFGPTSWLDSLAILEGTKAWDAFEFAATLAVAGLNIGRELIDEADAQEFADILLDETLAEEATSDPRFAFATSIADDPDLQALYVECAAHEEILRAGFGSPGMAGLPLSGGAIDEDAVAAARDFLEEIDDLETIDDDLAVGAVRTLCDLAFWALDAPEEVSSLRDVTEALRGHRHASVQVAAEQAIVAFDGERSSAHGDVATFVDLLARDRPKDLTALLHDDGCLQLATVERLAALGDEKAVTPLVDAWTNGPFIRSDVARLALRDVLESL